MKQTMFISAGEGERFARGSWDLQVGKTVPFKLGDRHAADATVISAEVAEDGSGVSLTVEVPDAPGTDAIAEQAAGHFSFSPKNPLAFHSRCACLSRGRHHG